MIKDAHSKIIISSIIPAIVRVVIVS